MKVDGSVNFSRSLYVGRERIVDSEPVEDVDDSDSGRKIEDLKRACKVLHSDGASGSVAGEVSRIGRIEISFS